MQLPSRKISTFTQNIIINKHCILPIKSCALLVSIVIYPDIYDYSKPAVTVCKVTSAFLP